MKKLYILNTIICALLSLVMMSCYDDMKFIAKGEPQQIQINATTGQFNEGSRAVFGHEAEIATITGYTFFYYETSETGGKVLSHKVYSKELPFTVTLNCPGDQPNLAILIANTPEGTFDGLALGSEITELNNYTHTWEHTYNAPSSSQILTWSDSEEVTSDTRQLNFSLNPNVAKVTLTIIDQTSDSQTVNLRVKRIRDKVRYAQKALYETGYSNEQEIPVQERGYFSYDMENMTLSKNADNSYSWYVPHNEPYIASNDVNEYSRETGRIPSGSTFIEIDDLKTDGTNLCTSYRIYPGLSEEGKTYETLKNFNIVADEQYHITVTIKNDGISIESTTKLDYVGTTMPNVSHKIKLPGNSNSYLIHPILQKINTKTPNQKDTVEYLVWELPVHERVNEYWNKVKGDNSRTLTKDSKWQVEVIWQDIKGRALYFSNEYATSKNDVFKGEGLNPIYFMLNRNKLFQKENITYNTTNDIYGNVLIGLKLLDENGNVVKFSENDAYRRTDGKNDYLWSWHLWITDYYPDNATPNTSKTTLYVGGQNVVDYQGYKFRTNLNSNTYTLSYLGNVQHYWHYGGTTFLDSKSEPIWTSGIYKNKWIMDRNIGAQSANNGLTEDPIEGFGMYYQYGRKDPFPYHGADQSKQETDYKRSLYEANGTTVVAHWDYESGKVPLNIGVMNPMTYFSYGSSSGASWTSETNTRPWYSPTTETGITASNGKKTLFDPCPPGWCIPKYDTFDFMCANNGIYTKGDRTSYAGDGTVAYPFIYYGYAHSQVGVEPNSRIRHYTRAQIRISGSTTDYLQINFPIQGYISPSGVNGSTLQLPKSDHKLDLRGYLWTVESSDASSQAAKGIGYGVTAKTGTNEAQCLIDIPAYIDYYPTANNGYFLQGKRGAYTTDFSTSRGQNVRCIQIPD